MVTEYKVIKPFGTLKVGDVLKLDGDIFKFENELSTGMNDFYSFTRVAFNMDMAEEYAKSGLLEPISNTKDPNDDNSLNKIKKVAQLIAQLKNTYNQRKANIEKKYNDGKIQTCLKVEHDTVYFNMMKLLNKFEAIINE